MMTTFYNNDVLRERLENFFTLSRKKYSTDYIPHEDILYTFLVESNVLKRLF